MRTSLLICLFLNSITAYGQPGTVRTLDYNDTSLVRIIDGVLTKEQVTTQLDFGEMHRIGTIEKIQRIRLDTTYEYILFNQKEYPIEEEINIMIEEDSTYKKHRYPYSYIKIAIAVNDILVTTYNRSDIYPYLSKDEIKKIYYLPPEPANQKYKVVPFGVIEVYTK